MSPETIFANCHRLRRKAKKNRNWRFEESELRTITWANRAKRERKREAFDGLPFQLPRQATPTR